MTVPIQAEYDQLVARKARLLQTIRTSNSRVRRYKRDLIDLEKARVVFTEVSKATSKETKERIEKLVTLAIRSVFEDEQYSFTIKFETKNNRVYAYPYIVSRGIELSPEEDVGGGIVDIISIAMKIILWHMEAPRKRNTLIIDEPFRFTGALVAKVGDILKYLSEKLEIQIIMVSHDRELINICDRVYSINKQQGISKISLIKGKRKRIRRRA